MLESEAPHTHWHRCKVSFLCPIFFSLRFERKSGQPAREIESRLVSKKTESEHEQQEKEKHTHTHRHTLELQRAYFYYAIVVWYIILVVWFV
jgi:hypothetical protein